MVNSSAQCDFNATGLHSSCFLMGEPAQHSQKAKQQLKQQLWPPGYQIKACNWPESCCRRPGSQLWQAGTRAHRGCWLFWTALSGPYRAYVRLSRNASWPTGRIAAGSSSPLLLCTASFCRVPSARQRHGVTPRTCRSPRAERKPRRMCSSCPPPSPAAAAAASLHSSCSDNLRGFFEQCFPTLLKRLFGYDGPSWLNLVARVRPPLAAEWGRTCHVAACRAAHVLTLMRPTPHIPPPTLAHPTQNPKEADAKALLKLLSPSGILFSAMYSADADGATQFFFPKERLPTHTQARDPGFCCCGPGNGCSGRDVCSDAAGTPNSAAAPLARWQPAASLGAPRPYQPHHTMLFPLLADAAGGACGAC